MTKRVLVAVVGIPLLVLALSFVPDWATMLLTALLCAIGAHELMSAVRKERGISVLTPLTTAAAALITLATYLAQSGSGIAPAFWNWSVLDLYNAMSGAEVQGGVYPILLPLTALAFLLVLFVYSILRYGREGSVPFADLTAALFAGLVFPLMLGCLLRMRMLPYGQILVWVPLVISFGSDTCALFAGMAFGKHKMAPLVSPHKTVEGGIGGLIGGVLGLLLLKWVAKAVAGVVFLSYWQLILLGLAGAAISEIGDLSFSVIKREYGIKDYGKLLPGHGGVLDRFDSVTFVAPFAYLICSLL